MLIATLGIMAPAISRWPLQFMVERPIWITVFLFAEVFSVLVYDLVTRHKPYGQTVVASLLIPALMPVAIGLSGTSGMGKVLGWVLRG